MTLSSFETFVGDFEMTLGDFETFLGNFEMSLGIFETFLGDFEMSLGAIEMSLGIFETSLVGKGSSPFGRGEVPSGLPTASGVAFRPGIVTFNSVLTSNLNLQTILVPVDFSDVTGKVVKAASEFARVFGSRMVLLHVSEPEPDFVGFEPGPQSVRVGVAREFKAEHAQLEELKQSLAGEGMEVLALHIQGPIAEKILQEAATHQAGMVVIGSHGHGALYSLLVGSVTSGVLKSARCPVLVVPSAAASSTK